MKIMKKPLIGIIMGSSSDSRIMHDAAEILDKFGIPHEDQIISAHRTPTRLEEYAKHAEKNGQKVSLFDSNQVSSSTKEKISILIDQVLEAIT